MPAAPEKIEVTHPERVVYPKAGYTKADVVGYYRTVSPYLVPALEGRPLSLQRWPSGLKGKGFFQQNLEDAPEWMSTASIEHSDRTVQHALVSDARDLRWLANRSVITLHMWSARTDALETPDWVVFDLDPAGEHFSEVLPLARSLRRLLEAAGLESIPKTSGKRGLHVLVPIARGPDHDQVTAWARGITRVLARLHPELSTTERMKSKRRGRLYLDALQNGRGKTVVAPYSLRDTPQATYSAPLRWSEVNARLDPGRFTLANVKRRLDRVGDLFAPALRGRQTLPFLGSSRTGMDEEVEAPGP
ncbi:MAG TPA: non-homologous end-joining DNA ligase [Myxococcaceae bacterium]|nr:non-homologous end-joining DNA ligase [Myxococcaceae bacterium]